MDATFHTECDAALAGLDEIARSGCVRSIMASLLDRAICDVGLTGRGSQSPLLSWWTLETQVFRGFTIDQPPNTTYEPFARSGAQQS